MNEREYALKQYRALDSVFSHWKPLYKEVRDFVFPYTGKFDGEDIFKRRDEYLLRTMILKYANVCAAGMEWGITSPTRKWAKLEASDDAMNKVTANKEYFDTCTNILAKLLLNGRFYQEIFKYYLEMSIYGTAAMFIEEDMEIGVRFHTFTIGEYRVGCDSHGTPNTFARKFKLNGDQFAHMFGGKPEGNNGDENKEVIHVVAPNPDYTFGSAINTKFSWKEYYVSGDKVVTSGYHEFPVSVGRWFKRGSDIYGTGPGIWSLGDAKQLQVMWRDMSMAAELTVKPPIQAPSDIMANGGVNILPGQANYYNPIGNSQGVISPLWNVQMDFTGVANLADKMESCIQEHFNYSVFQLLSQMEKGTRTAREVIELSAEKMSVMGPLVDQMETEILPSIIDRVVAIAFRNGIFPPPPQELEGADFKISYNSTLSQAQAQNDITPIVDTVNIAVQMAGETQKPEILDKIDFDKVVDSIADRNGVPIGIVVPDETVKQIRYARAQQEQQMQAAQMAQMNAEIAKTASQAKLTEDSALTQVLGGVAGG